MEPFKMQTKHGVALYDASTAGVENDQGEDDQEVVQEDQEEVQEDQEDVPDNQEEVQEVQDDQEEQESVEGQAKHPQETVADEEALQGEWQPVVRRSKRMPKKRELLDIGTSRVKLTKPSSVKLLRSILSRKPR
jgi:hypothetical protein